jgi:hypothetical protein
MAQVRLDLLGSLAAFLLWFSSANAAMAATSDPVLFSDYFVDKALRLEFFQVGNAREMTQTLHAMAEESSWPESHQNLITSFPYGKLKVVVHDASSGKLIFTKGFDSLFDEYATTEPALSGGKKVFQTTARIPMPTRPVTVKIEHRLPDNSYEEVFSELIDPNDVRIRRESTATSDSIVDIQIKGAASDCVDLVFLAEGYMSNERAKFQNDVQRLTDHLFTVAPYAANRDRFNVRGVFRVSDESGSDDPNKGIFRKTALNTSFNTLGIDRYLLLEDNHRMRQMAAAVPYDTIVVLVNTSTYGGGSICQDFCVTCTDSPVSSMVFVHELGHGLAYLADEYIGNVTYSNMYPENIEPVEPNITRELDPDKIKWRAFLSEGVSLPTRMKRSEASARTVGAFEGGGYLLKGMYRSQQSCIMGSADPNEHFCAACNDAIQRIIDHYSAK